MAHLNRKHIWIYKILRPLVIVYLKVLFDYRYEKAKDLPEQYMVLSNHATDYDPLLVACSFPKQMYFMASEHIARWGFVSKLITFLVDPIMRCKGASAVAPVKEMLLRIRAGHNVCFFPEGVRTWDGVTGPILPATAKLVKTSGCGLVTYKLTGAYFASPMWSGAKVRRGPVRGSIVHIYTAQQVKDMSLQQLQKVINADLYEDAYARQRMDPKSYRSKLGAARLENLLFICPKCGAYDSFRSPDGIARCGCGCGIGYGQYGMLEGCRFETVKELLDWQRQRVCADVASAEPYKAAHGVLRTVKDHVSHEVTQGQVVMSADTLRCGDFCAGMDQITEFAMHGQRNLVFTAGGKYYELKITEGGNALKFHLYFQTAKERKA